MHVLAFSNQKGGVGKTTLAVHAAAWAAAAGHRVLVVDLDAQGNATLALTGNTELLFESNGAERLFLPAGRNAPLPIRSDSLGWGVDLLHGHQKVDAMDRVMIDQVLPVREILRSLPYDVVIFDSPPSLGIRNMAPILLADELVIPLEPDYFALVGVANTMNVASQLQGSNPNLKARIVINRHNMRVRSEKKTIEELGEALETFDIPTVLAHPYLRQTAAVSTALANNRPLWKEPTAKAETKSAWRKLCASLFPDSEED